MEQERKYPIGRNIFKHGDRRLSTYDLLDDQCNLFRVNNNFGTWEALFADFLKGKTTKEHRPKWQWRQRIIRKVVAIFLELLVKDLIYNHETFVFPYKNFGKMFIGINYNFKSPKYVFNIETGGLNFAPRIELTPLGLKKTGQLYYMCFLPKWRDLMEQEISNGRRYKVQKFIDYGLQQSEIYRSQRDRFKTRKDSQE